MSLGVQPPTQKGRAEQQEQSDIPKYDAGKSENRKTEITTQKKPERRPTASFFVQCVKLNV